MTDQAPGATSQTTDLAETREPFDDARPRRIRRENSGWLAVSPEGFPFPVGVEAWSADDASNKWRKALRERLPLFTSDELDEMETAFALARQAPRRTTGS